MKSLRDLFDKPWFQAALYVMVLLWIFEWIIFPLLTVADTLLNAFGAFLLTVAIGLTINRVSEMFRKKETDGEDKDI